MHSENRFLREMSIAAMLWISAATVLANLPLVLAIAGALSVPVDIVTTWAVQKLFERAESVEARILLATIPISVSFGLNLLGYAALAWTVGQIIEGHSPTIKDAFMRLSGPRLTRIVGTLVYANWAILKPACFVAAAYVFARISLGDIAAAVVLLALAVTILYCGTFRYIDYSFTEFPAIFENTAYRRAAERSLFLVKGRRGRLLGIMFGVGIAAYLVSACMTDVLPRTIGAPAPDPGSLAGLLTIVYKSLVNSILLSLLIVFQTLLYFRLRREKHDLTYFDLSQTGTIEPAGRLAEAAR